MNILHLTCSLSRNAGGLFFSVRSLAKQLLAQGTQTSALAPNDEFTSVDAQKWSPVPVRGYSVVGPQSLGYSPKIDSLIGTPDIQHMHGIWMYHSLINWKTARARKVPYLISPRGMLDAWAVRNSGWKKKVAAKLYEGRHLSGASCLHALCDAEANSIRDFGLTNPICVIPNGIDLQPVIDDKERTAATVDKANKQLLFLGRIHPKKGLQQMLKAFAALHIDDRQDWVITIAGWDQDHQADLQELADQLSITSMVDFVGPKFGHEKEQLLNSCDAFILPSFSEGLPMSVLEAWSYRKPSIITTACNLPEGPACDATIECQPDTASLKVAMKQLFSMTHLERATMGNNALNLVKQKFTWPIVGQQMQSVYDWLLGVAEMPTTVRLD